jgi:hypothetical protein
MSAAACCVNGEIVKAMQLDDVCAPPLLFRFQRETARPVDNTEHYLQVNCG